MRLIELPNPVNVYLDASKRGRLYVPEDVAETISAYQRTGYRDIHIPAAVAPALPAAVAMSLQDVDVCRGLCVIMDNGFDLTLNGAATALEFRRLDERPENTAEYLRALLQCAVSSVAITNPLAVAITGRMIWWGDAA